MSKAVSVSKSKTGRYVKTTQSALDSGLKDGHNHPVFLKLGLHLRRVNVHVDARRVHFQKQDIQRELTRGKQPSMARMTAP